jgi:K+-sensing histidine kinase KdpD
VNPLSRRREYAFAVTAVAVATAICFAIYPYFGLANLVMIYLLGTLAVAMRGHRGPAALSSLLNVLAFDFFFVPPRFTLTISDMQYLFTFGVLFTTAMMISHLVIRLREERDAVRESEQRSLWLMEKAKQAELAAESERLRSSLLSSVSHDIRTPLAAIVGSASALLEKEAIRNSRAVRELLENIQEEGQRLSRLVQNLLEATRLEASSVLLNKERGPLEEVIGAALERLGTSLGDRDVKVEIPEDLPLIPMDPALIEQVFVNLFENAARHTPARSPVEVRVTQEGQSVQVSVADRGPGLRDDELERVFDKFYHSPGSPGVGLGLSICRAIAKAHGGTISAANRPGGGAVFSLMLPLKA